MDEIDLRDALSLLTLIEQQEAQDALLRRSEVASAVALVFGDKKDEFGRAMERMARFDPDRKIGRPKSKPADVKSQRALARELYPFLFTGRYGSKN